MDFQMGWWRDGTLYACQGIVRNPGLINVYITYTMPEALTVPTMSGSTPALAWGNVNFSVPGGQQNTSWGDAEQFLFNWGDGSNSGWVWSTASHTWPVSGTYQVTFQVRCSVHTGLVSPVANAW